MTSLDFKFNWVDAGGIQGPELSSTWAELKILVNGSTVTRVLDQRAQTTRDNIFVPLYPLAEWFATNWWFLNREFRNSAKECESTFQHRHKLGASREGYAFPDLRIVPAGRQVRLEWKRGSCRWNGLEYLEDGHASIDGDEFREKCADFIDKVLRRLDACGVEDTLLRSEWAEIQNADAEESAFCEAAAGLGWDPYAIDDSKRQFLLRLASRLGNGVLEEAIPVLNTDDPEPDFHAIMEALGKARSKGPSLEGIRKLCGIFQGPGQPSAHHPPWETGYRLARDLRMHLKSDAEPFPSLNDLGKALGADDTDLEAAFNQAATLTELVDGVVTQNEDGFPAFGLRATHKANRSFSFCRALSEVLMTSRPDTLLTRAHTERQQRNRAFAAEFLAPASALQSRTSGPVVDSEDIDELAAEFGVSYHVVRYQLENQLNARLSEPGTVPLH